MRAYYRRPGVAERWRERVASRRDVPSSVAAARRWDAANPEKVAAQRLARRALAHGEIARQACETCGAHAEMHHDDYSRPLEVRWLCRLHHMAVHYPQEP